MRKIVILVLIFAALPPFSAYAAPGTSNPLPLFSLGLWSSYSFPSPADQQNYIGIGAGAAGRIGAEYILPFFPFVFLVGGLEYDFRGVINTFGSEYSLSFLSTSAGIGARLPLLRWLTLRATGTGGYFYGFLNNPGLASGSGDPILSASLGLLFGLGPQLGLDVSGRYTAYVSIHQSIDMSLGLMYNFLPPGAIEIQQMNVDGIYPVLRTFYDTHPIGRLTLVNDASSPATKVSVSLRIPQFMESSKECASFTELKPGEVKTVDLFALFTPKILDTIQDTKTAVDVTIFEHDCPVVPRRRREATLRWCTTGTR